MMSQAYIDELKQEAAELAEAEGTRPASIRDFRPDSARDFIRRIPFLGDYVPEGWIHNESDDDLFVDSSGFGTEGEPALTIGQFIARLADFHKTGDTYGFGISQSGQFQVYIRIYRPDPRDFTHTGALTRRELAALGKG